MKSILKKAAGLSLAAALAWGMTGCANDTDSHEHTFATEWTSNATHHWHAATCGHTAEVKDKAKHSFGDYVSNNDATTEADGTKTRTCSVCGYADTVIAINDDFVEINYSKGNFFISPTELTYAEWYEVYQWAVTNGYVFQNLGREGSNETDGAAPIADSKQPVTLVSWRDAVVWCNAASEKAGLTPVYEYKGSVLKEAENYNSWGTNSENITNVSAGNGKAEKATVNTTANGYRLPTEAEWEYAAKGGADYTYSGSDTINEVAWYSGNSSDETKNVGTKAANKYGLHDMSGNVWEWCQGTWSSDYPDRVFRGGSWFNDADYCAVSCRGYLTPCGNNDGVGFRVVRNAN